MYPQEQQPPRNNPNLPVHPEDVAEYILAHWGPMDAWKLQKLTYYCQAWSLAWGRGPMFPDSIEAWQNGPVSPRLFSRHRGEYTVGTVGGNAAIIDQDRVRRATIIDVYGFYGQKTGQELRELTHAERPWRQTRLEAGVRDGDFCDRAIPQSLMEDYYGGLTANRQAAPV